MFHACIAPVSHEGAICAGCGAGGYSLQGANAGHDPNRCWEQLHCICREIFLDMKHREPIAVRATVDSKQVCIAPNGCGSGNKAMLEIVVFLAVSRDLQISRVSKEWARRAHTPMNPEVRIGRLLVRRRVSAMEAREPVSRVWYDLKWANLVHHSDIRTE